MAALSELCTRDMVLYFPGDHSFAGEHKGIDVVLDTWRRMREETGGDPAYRAAAAVRRRPRPRDRNPPAPRRPSGQAARHHGRGPSARWWATAAPASRSSRRTSTGSTTSGGEPGGRGRRGVLCSRRPRAQVVRMLSQSWSGSCLVRPERSVRARAGTGDQCRAGAGNHCGEQRAGLSGRLDLMPRFSRIPGASASVPARPSDEDHDRDSRACSGCADRRAQYLDALGGEHRVEREVLLRPKMTAVHAVSSRLARLRRGRSPRATVSCRRPSPPRALLPSVWLR